MYPILLTVYTGESLIGDSFKKSFIDAIPQNSLFYLLLFLLIVFLFYVLFVFILPLSKKNPEKLFKRYREVRQNVEVIDDLYNRKKLTYDEYVSLQFESAKEYEHLIIILSKFPEYKQKLESYSLVTASSKEIADITIENKKQTAEDKTKKKEIDYLFNTLLPRAKYFSEDEIKLAIRDVGYGRDIAIAVIKRIKDSGIAFGSVIEPKTNKVADFVNTLFASKTKDVDIDKEIIETNKKSIETGTMFTNKQSAINKKADVVIDIRETIRSSKNKPQAPIEKNIDLSRVDEPIIIPKKKGGIIAAFKVLFSKKKPEVHSVDEIKDIFKDIENALKEKK